MSLFEISKPSLKEVVAHESMPFLIKFRFKELQLKKDPSHDLGTFLFSSFNIGTYFSMELLHLQ